jgi:hypothetical protein
MIEFVNHLVDRATFGFAIDSAQVISTCQGHEPIVGDASAHDQWRCECTRAALAGGGQANDSK